MTGLFVIFILRQMTQLYVCINEDTLRCLPQRAYISLTFNPGHNCLLVLILQSLVVTIYNAFHLLLFLRHEIEKSLQSSNEKKRLIFSSIKIIFIEIIHTRILLIVVLV